MTSLRRVKFRKVLSELYLPSYDLLCEELPAEWDPFQGWRAFFYQDQLYAQGRTIPGPGATKENPLGKIITRARGGESAHNYGCATDWTVWEDGKPIWMEDSDKRWEVYFQALDKIGLKKGADFGDNPHNELEISVSWKVVLEQYKKGGMEAAKVFIKEKASK